MTHSTNAAAPATRSLRWRVVDIVTVAVIGIAFGVVILGWNYVSGVGQSAFDAALPGSSGTLLGIWMIAGVVGGFVVRKPGAAFLAEVIAAMVEMTAGSQWGLGGLLSGVVQGFGVELVLAAFLYKRWGVQIAVLAGVVAAALEWCYELVVYNADKTIAYKGSYLGFCLVSGALLCGLLGWLFVRALARTGALNQFAAGREARKTVA